MAFVLFWIFDSSTLINRGWPNFVARVYKSCFAHAGVTTVALPYLFDA